MNADIALSDPATRLQTLLRVRGPLSRGQARAILGLDEWAMRGALYKAFDQVYRAGSTDRSLIGLRGDPRLESEIAWRRKSQGRRANGAN